jgi:hypothetical protein
MTRLVDEDDLDGAGVVLTRSGRWHVLRHGEPFGCAQGAADLVESGGPYEDAETVEERLGVGEDVREMLRDRVDSGESVCLHCADCYGVDPLGRSDA